MIPWFGLCGRVPLTCPTLWIVSCEAVADPSTLRVWLLIDTTMADCCFVVINYASHQKVSHGSTRLRMEKIGLQGTGHGRVNWPTGTRESKLAYTDTGGYIGIQGLRRWTETTTRWDA